jgi:sensor histidine kinase YesM
MRSEIFQPLVLRLKRPGLALITGLFYYLLVAFVNLGLDGEKWAKGYQVILAEMGLVITYVYVLFHGFDWVSARFDEKIASGRQLAARYARELLAISLLSSTLITLLVFIPQVLLSRYLQASEGPISNPDEVFLRIRLSYVVNLIVAALFYTIRAEYLIAQRLHRSELQKEQLEKDNYKAQLELLTNQVSPHFLFNNFNTLTSLIYKDQGLAVQFVSQLSGLFRCILEYRDKELIDLRAEINWMNSYIFLLKMRFRENIRFLIEVPDEYLHDSLPPLSTQILIENAIKHNIVSSEQPLLMHVYVDDERRLVFKNNLQKRSNVMDCPNPNSGLESVRRRYDFFIHESVEVEQTATEFIVKLPLIKVKKARVLASANG